MPLQAILETIDDLDEGLRGLYAEQDGKFVLDLDDTVREHPRVLNLSNAYKREQEARRGASDKLRALEERLSGIPDDFDPAEIETLRSAAKKNGKGEGGGQDDGALAKLREQMEKRSATEIEKRDARIGVLEGEIKRLVVDHGVDAALDEAGISPKFKAAARALLKERGVVKLVEDGGTFSAIVESDMGPVTAREFVKSWSASDEGKAFVLPAEGSGATGNNRGKFGEDNPFAKTHWNKTKQSLMFRDDKTKAERLAKAAGFSNIDAGLKASAAL